MKTVNLWLSAAGALAIFIAAGCSGSSAAATGAYVPKKPVALSSGLLPAGEEAKYFPFKVGNQWTFSSEMSQVFNGRASSPVKQEVTYRVTKVAPAPNGGTDAWFDILTDEKVVDRQLWRVNKTGMYQLALGKSLQAFSSPQQVMLFPVKTGDTFKWAGTIKADNGEMRTGTNEGKVAGQQSIDTNTGSFNALAIESKGDLDSAKTKSQVASVIWFIPNVGIGRYRQEALGELKDPKAKGKTARFAIVQLMKLKSYSLK